jgi:hypothetical protein
MESTPTSFQKQNTFFLLAILRSAETDEEIENLRQSAKEQVASGMLTQAQGDEFDAACNTKTNRRPVGDARTTRAPLIRNFGSSAGGK